MRLIPNFKRGKREMTQKQKERRESYLWTLVAIAIGGVVFVLFVK